MRRREKSDLRGLKVTFEAVAGRQGGRGIFAIEDEAEEVARRTKLAQIAERIAAYDQGYEGGRRQCPRCGRRQQYKGERGREWVFDCGTVTVQRAYYGCPTCGATSCPLDEKLGLVEGKEQGRVREKLALLAVLTPYL
jgi:phage terminase large subunit GpA-like protein